VVIEALIDKAKSTYNPLTLNAFIGSVVHDVKIGGLSASQVLSLAVKYHGFSGSNLQTATIPTLNASSPVGSAEVVQEPQSTQVVSQFLGGKPGPVPTPPLNGEGAPVTVSSGSSSSANSSSASSSASSASHGTTPAAPTTTTTLPNFDPTPC
jgi:hypothetical protein